MDVEFICLANSRKLGRKCVAGIRTDGSGWIRPVSSRADGALEPEHYWLNTGAPARLLDIIKAYVVKPSPKPHQPENWDLEPGAWQHVGKLSGATAWASLRPFIHAGPDIFGNQSDRVNYSAIQTSPVNASLALIRPSNISWYVTTSFRGSPQVRARFLLSGARYDLVVTDPEWELACAYLKAGVFSTRGITQQPHTNLLLTISLGEPVEESQDCFKLVAAVVLL